VNSQKCFAAAVECAQHCSSFRMTDLSRFYRVAAREIMSNSIHLPERAVRAFMVQPLTPEIRLSCPSV
jgi:hypothetical protein